MPPRRKAGRPSKFTHKVRKALVAAKEKGLSSEDAARVVGVGAQTVLDWLRKGAEAKPNARGKAGEFRAFRAEMEAAEARRAAKALALVQKSAEGGLTEKTTTTVTDEAGTTVTTVKERVVPGSLEAAVFILKTTRPKEFNLAHRTELTGKDGGPVEASLSSALAGVFSKPPPGYVPPPDDVG